MINRRWCNRAEPCVTSTAAAERAQNRGPAGADLEGQAANRDCFDGRVLLFRERLRSHAQYIESGNGAAAVTGT